MSDRTRKLVLIRHQTDHDLRVLVSHELDRGFALADVKKAEKAYLTARAILPRISDLSEGDRLNLESRLKELRSRLDHVPAYANVRPYPASFAS